VDDRNPADRPLSERVRDIQLIQRALGRAVRDALIRRERAGNPVCAWRNDKVVWIAPEDIEIPPPVD
jgi:hypothetical protein